MFFNIKNLHTQVTLAAANIAMHPHKNHPGCEAYKIIIPGENTDLEQNAFD